MYSLYLPIADIVGHLVIDNEQFYRLLKKNYRTLKQYPNPDFTIYTVAVVNPPSPVIVDSRRLTGRFFYPKSGSSFRGISFSLIEYIQHFVLPKQILFLHASAFARQNRGYVFCGPSGIGKSTVVRQVPANGVILSDDTAVIKKEGTAFFIYPSPFDHGKFKPLGRQKARLTGIFFLKQADKNMSLPKTPIASLDELFYNTHIVYRRTRSLAYSQKQAKAVKSMRKNMAELTMLKKSFQQLYRFLIGLSAYCKPKTLLLTKPTNYLEKL